MEKNRARAGALGGKKAFGIYGKRASRPYFINDGSDSSDSDSYEYDPHQIIRKLLLKYNRDWNQRKLMGNFKIIVKTTYIV